MAELAAALSRDQEFADLHDNVCEEIIQMFDTIHSPPDKYRLACEVVTTLRSSCPDLASRIFAYLSEEQHDGIVAINIEQGLFCMLHLLIKALWGLARSKHLSDNDVTRVLQVLSQVGETLPEIGCPITLGVLSMVRGIGEAVFASCKSRHLADSYASALGR